MLRQSELSAKIEAQPAPIHVPIVERAFKLAANGAFEAPGEIAQQLESEGYIDVQEHIRDCPLLKRQLLAAIRRARST